MQTVPAASPATSALTACIFDVDGVLLASPHERAWREALTGFADPTAFTVTMYQTQVAGKPRLAGARAALEALNVPDAAGKAAAYAERKQTIFEELIADGAVAAYPDALRLVDALAALDWPMAVASSSKNANEMLRPMRLPSGRGLLDVFTANVNGRDVARGKPDPEIFLLASGELGIAAVHCLVIEDAPAGVAAARAGNMAGLGVARLQDAASLQQAGANLVVTSLDDVDIPALIDGRIRGRQAPA